MVNELLIVYLSFCRRFFKELMIFNGHKEPNTDRESGQAGYMVNGLLIVYLSFCRRFAKLKWAGGQILARILMTRGINILETGRSTIRMEAAAVAALEGLLDERFEKAVQLIFSCKGRNESYPQ